MTPSSDRQHKPRNWDQLRELVLKQDSMTVDQLERRKRRAHQMTYAIWLVPVALVGVAPAMISDGWSWLLAGTVALIAYGAVSSWWLGTQWERRWDALIRQKAARSD
jgi:hypothetical protein